MLDAIGRIHAATPTVPPSMPRRDTLEVPSRSAFFDAVADDAKWSDGPYAERARALVLENLDDIRGRFARYR